MLKLGKTTKDTGNFNAEYFLSSKRLFYGVPSEGVFNRQLQYVMLIRCESCLSVLVSLLVWLNAVLASLCCEVAKSCLVSPFGPASIPPIMPNSLHEKD